MPCYLCYNVVAMLVQLVCVVNHVLLYVSPFQTICPVRPTGDQAQAQDHYTLVHTPEIIWG